MQRSGFPQAYAKHEPDAALLSAALTGHAPASFACSATKSSRAGDPARVRAALTRAFGSGVLPAGRSAQPSEVLLPVRTTTARAVGPAPGSGSSKQRGWELAHWAVANSAALHIQRVSYAGREWAAGTGEASWRGTGTGQGGPTGRGAGRDADEVRITVTK